MVVAFHSFFSRAGSRQPSPPFPPTFLPDDINDEPFKPSSLLSSSSSGALLPIVLVLTLTVAAMLHRILSSCGRLPPLEEQIMMGGDDLDEVLARCAVTGIVVGRLPHVDTAPSSRRGVLEVHAAAVAVSALSPAPGTEHTGDRQPPVRPRASARASLREAQEGPEADASLRLGHCLPPLTVLVNPLASSTDYAIHGEQRSERGPSAGPPLLLACRQRGGILERVPFLLFCLHLYHMFRMGFSYITERKAYKGEQVRQSQVSGGSHSFDEKNAALALWLYTHRHGEAAFLTNDERQQRQWQALLDRSRREALGYGRSDADDQPQQREPASDGSASALVLQQRFECGLPLRFQSAGEAPLMYDAESGHAIPIAFRDSHKESYDAHHHALRFVR